MALQKTMSGFVRSLSRKRILSRSVSFVEGSFSPHFDFEDNFEPDKRRRCDQLCTETSVLQSLPQEILVKIICGVNHDDLKRLVVVSKPISEAAKVAKEMHFAFATPSKAPDLKNFGESSEDEKAPNAPLRIGMRRRFKEEELEEVSVSLFGSDSDEERWPRRKLFKD